MSDEEEEQNIDEEISFKIMDSIDLKHKRNISLQSNNAEDTTDAESDTTSNICNRFFSRIRAFLTSTEFKKSCRPTFTLMISLLFSLVPSLIKILGTLNYLAAVMTLLLFTDVSLSSQSLGGVLQIFFRAMISVALAFSTSYFSLYVSFKTSATEILLCIFTFLFTFAFTVVRAEKPQWAIPMVLAKVILIIEVIVGYRDYNHVNTITIELLVSTVVGCAIYILGIVLVFPTTASGTLEVKCSQGREIIRKGELLVTLDNCVNLLKSCIHRFKTGDQDTGVNIRSILSANFAKLSGLLGDSKLEINYGYMSAKDISAITKSVKQIIQHLGAMDSVKFPLGSQELRSKVSDSVETLGNACISDLQHIRKYLKDHLNLQSEILPDMIEALQKFDLQQDKV